MEVCFPCLRMRRLRLASSSRPFHVDRNDEGIAITSSSFFLNAHSSWVLFVGRHRPGRPRLFYHAALESHPVLWGGYRNVRYCPALARAFRGTLAL